MRIVISYLVRLFCKSVEFFLRVRTFVITHHESDPTNILLRNMTDQQIYWQSKFATLDADHRAQKPNVVRVAIVIPFKDAWKLTRVCIDSIIIQDLKGIEVCIILVDNNSTMAETAVGIKQILSQKLAPNIQIQLCTDAGEFNFSRINNRAVSGITNFIAEYILFLNNDVEFHNATDLALMVQMMKVLPNIGALGCTLQYPTGFIQHLFVAPGIKIVAAHPLRGQKLSSLEMWFEAPRPVAAVTGAVMMVPLSLFNSVKGFDENLPQVGQDVDLCLKFQQSGRVNWVIPKVIATHYEGASREKTIDPEQVNYIYKKWGKRLVCNEFYSNRFSQWSEKPLYRWFEKSYPWKLVI